MLPVDFSIIIIRTFSAGGPSTSSAQSTQSSPQTSGNPSQLSSASSDEIIDIQDEPSQKKAKVEDTEDAEAILARISRVQKKVVSEVNALLELVEDLTQKIEPSNVKVEHLPATGFLAASVHCFLCKKDIKLITTKYTASITNFKGHFSRVHLKKGEGSDMKLKDANQPLLSTFYKPISNKSPGQAQEVEIVESIQEASDSSSTKG